MQEGPPTSLHHINSAILYTSSPASRVSACWVPATRMQSHPQKMQLRLHHNPARLAVFTPRSAGAIYRARRTCFCSIFHLPSSPDSEVCCCAFPLRPVQGGKLRFSRASADTLLASAESPGEISWHMQLLEQDKVERPFTIAAKRCARRSIPDSHRIHHPPARYRPATS